MRKFSFPSPGFDRTDEDDVISRCDHYYGAFDRQLMAGGGLEGIPCIISHQFHTNGSTAFDRVSGFYPNVGSPAHEQTSKRLRSGELEAVTGWCIVMTCMLSSVDPQH